MADLPAARAAPGNVASSCGYHLMVTLEVFYRTTDPNIVVPKLEQLVRADVGALSPLNYSVTGVAEKKSATREYMSQFALGLVGGAMPGLLTIEFELPANRMAWLRVTAGHTRDLTYCGPMTYLLSVDRPIGGEVGFEKRKALVVAPKFTGGPDAGKLNAVPGLADRVDKVLVPKIIVGMGSLELKPVFRLVPSSEGTRLLIRTLPLVKMHFNSVSGSTNAGEVLKICAAIEAAL
jgi:hypothetical protein